MTTKNIFYLIMILLASIFIVSCNNIRQTKIQDFPTSIEDTKEYYGKNFLEYTRINDSEVLVKFKNENDIYFNVVNFKEKKKYILPILENTVIFKSAISDHELIFEVSGGNNINSYEVFPYLVRATKKDEEYELSKEDKWSEVGESMAAKSSDKGVIRDLKIERNGLKIYFSAYEGEEAQFYAAFPDIPSTYVKFIDNNMIIELRESKISDDLDLGILKDINLIYVDSIDFKEFEDQVIISIDLSDTTKEYLLYKRIPDESGEDLPFLNIQFR
ncbi:hypothetical protein [Paratissierella segnis]|uniref:Lipoprotein n=1 Tax=Paratissierella segnis TaxID=2763679 RepID=A0A926EVE8_9FIRM|nr:hypothetical protein [Paratissierella segnis]MBC8587179.1 hypothetical protein [Paratissierella segnis]